MSDAVEILLTLKIGNQLFADMRRVELLKAIVQTGSLSKAAKTVGISYKTAWDAVDEINRLAETPFVLTLTGGKGGGGAQLTEYAQRFIALYELLTKIQHDSFTILKNETIPFNDVLKVAAKLSIQSSARNQLYGTIIAIDSNDISGQVTVLLQDKLTRMVAYITHSSIERLNLTIGKEVILLIKAPQIEFAGRINSNHYLTRIDSFVTSEHRSEFCLSLPSGIMFYASRTIEELDKQLIQQGAPVDIYIHPDNIIVASLA